MTDYLLDLLRLAPYFIAVLACGYWLGRSTQDHRNPEGAYEALRKCVVDECPPGTSIVEYVSTWSSDVTAEELAALAAVESQRQP